MPHTLPARVNLGVRACAHLVCALLVSALLMGLLPACAQPGGRAAQPEDAGTAQSGSGSGAQAWDALQSLPLPRLPGADERVLIEVRLGRFNAGQELVLRGADGRLIGSVSPHGIRHRAASGSYSVPVPDDALTGARRKSMLRVSLRVERAGAASRAPRAEEVLMLRAVIAPR